MLGSLAQRVGFNEIECGQVSLAVDEALCNIINHGYERKPDGRIWLPCGCFPSPNPGLRVVIEDRAEAGGPGLDPPAIWTTSVRAGWASTSSRK
jgi:anti-sigma regulatory factor (Ser/Thr protein kinase)